MEIIKTLIISILIIICVIFRLCDPDFNYIDDGEIKKDYKDVVKFKNNLNCKENLELAKDLIKIYQIEKNIPRDIEIYYAFTNLDLSRDCRIGHRGYIELDINNIITIYDSCYFEDKDFIKINIDYFNKLK